MSAGLDRLENLRLIAFDVDGVFTDGRIYFAADGSETKAFHTQDGYGVRRLLDSGVAVAVISGRTSSAVEKRMAEPGLQGQGRSAGRAGRVARHRNRRVRLRRG